MQYSLRKETLWIKGNINGAQVAKKKHNKTLPVRIWVRADSASQYMKNFVGEKFSDTLGNHKNNENWLPTEIIHLW